jgi:hypothetical protein
MNTWAELMNKNYMGVRLGKIFASDTLICRMGAFRGAAEDALNITDVARLFSWRLHFSYAEPLHKRNVKVSFQILV